MAFEQKQQVAVVGALAYDEICTTDTHLTNEGHPLLNCKLTSLEEVFGGCGANISYNLAALGSTPLLLACSGIKDDQRYLSHCQRSGISSDTILRVSDTHCARAIIMTDPGGKQFTGFFPGPVPTAERWRSHIANSDLSGAAVFVQAPFPTDLMYASLQHATSLAQNTASPGRPLKIWCPGQYADHLNAEDIRHLSELSDWIVGNAHEIAYLSPHLASEKLILQTNGSSPTTVTYPDGHCESYAVPNVPGAVDPTGCGDAFLASLAHHMAEQRGPVSWRDTLPEAIALGNHVAGICLLEAGGQRHRLAD